MIDTSELVIGDGKTLYADKNVGFSISEELCDLPEVSAELRQKIAEHLERRLPQIAMWVQAESEDMKPRLPTRDELRNTPPSKIVGLLIEALD